MSTENGLWCVVPAAGRGARFGGDIPKQYLPLCGKPLIQHTLERLTTHPRVAGVVVVLAAHDPWWPGIDRLHAKPVLSTTGGAERSDSVLAGLRHLPPEVAAGVFVLVHDAARPCLRYEDLSRLIRKAAGAGGGLLAAPLRDTLKRADNDNRSAGTEAREQRWRAFTPQMFRRGELVEALERAREIGVDTTDESMAMELMGHRPLLVQGAEDNLKITTPADLALAEFIIGRTT